MRSLVLNTALLLAVLCAACCATVSSRDLQFFGLGKCPPPNFDSVAGFDGQEWIAAPWCVQLRPASMPTVDCFITGPCIVCNGLKAPRTARIQPTMQHHTPHNGGPNRPKAFCPLLGLARCIPLSDLRSFHCNSPRHAPAHRRASPHETHRLAAHPTACHLAPRTQRAAPAVCCPCFRRYVQEQMPVTYTTESRLYCVKARYEAVDATDLSVSGGWWFPSPARVLVARACRGAAHGGGEAAWPDPAFWCPGEGIKNSLGHVGGANPKLVLRTFAL